VLKVAARNAEPVQLRDSESHLAALSPDGRWYARADDTRVVVQNPRSLEDPAIIPTFFRRPSYLRFGASAPWDSSELAWAPDSRLLAVAGWPDGPRLIMPETGDTVATLPRGWTIDSDTKFSANGHLLATSLGVRRVGVRDVSSIGVYDVSSGRGVTLTHPDLTNFEEDHFAFSADGALLASSGTNFAVLIWDPKTGRLRTTCPVPKSSRKELREKRRSFEQPDLSVVLAGLVTPEKFSEDGRTLSVRDWKTDTHHQGDVATGRSRPIE
jgi:WD40 repeat protein